MLIVLGKVVLFITLIAYIGMVVWELVMEFKERVK